MSECLKALNHQSENNSSSHNSSSTDQDGNDSCFLSTPNESSSSTKVSPVQSLLQDVKSNAWKQIEKNDKGERTFHFCSLPIISLDTFHSNNNVTAQWLLDQLLEEPDDKLIMYIGFEVFYELHFDKFCEWLVTTNGAIPVVFSSLVKSTQEYIQQKEKYDALENKSSLTTEDWLKRIILHMGSPNAMDLMLYHEDPNGYIQGAWMDGRLIILSPDLFIVDDYIYRGRLSQVFQIVISKLSKGDDSLSRNQKFQVVRTLPCDYKLFDKDISDTKSRVAEAQSMEDVFGEVFEFISKYVARGQLDSPCYFETGFESIHLYKAVSRFLERKGMKIPMTRVGIVNSRNGAIGDSCHTFYATAPDSFPVTVCGDTAALLAGGLSMMNIQSNNRFGVIIVLNNHGMAIEDSISKRYVDGHSYQYEYAKVERKRDIYSLVQLKNVIQVEVLNALRSHLWGIAPQRSNAIILNIDIPSMRRDSVVNGLSYASYYLDDSFGERFAEIEGPRSALEGVVDILYDVLNADHSQEGSKVPVKIVGCSAVEFMEVFSQVSMTSREKMSYIPMPTDILATRTLLPGLLESPKRTVCSSYRTSNFINSNNIFSVFVSNSIFGTDGLNNLISTQLEYGTSKLIHLVYDAADVVSHYSLIGQAHRNFGNRKSDLLLSLYACHQSYEGQILCIRIHDDDASSRIRDGLCNPDVQIILVDMGAPNLIMYNI